MGEGVGWATRGITEGVERCDCRGAHHHSLSRLGSADVNNIVIVFPAFVYGLSPSSSSTRSRISVTVRDCVATVKELKADFNISQDTNIAGYVHANDLADICARHSWTRRKTQLARIPDFVDLWRTISRAATISHLPSACAGDCPGSEGKCSSLLTDEIRHIGIDSDPFDRKIVEKRTARAHGYGTNAQCRSERRQKPCLIGYQANEP